MGTVTQLLSFAVGFGQRKTASLLNLLLMLPFVVVFGGGCIDMPTGVVYDTDPPGDLYPDKVYVSFIIPESEYDRIYYTLDGQMPAEHCLEWNGTAFEIAESLILKYIVVKGGVSSEVKSISYEIAGTGGSGGGGTSTNLEMLNTWVDYEETTRQIIMDQYFGGCEPVVGCSGTGLELSHMNTWFICDSLDLSQPVPRTVIHSDKASCEAAGHGWITWLVAQEGFGGRSVFTYKNFTLTMPAGCDLTAETGQIVGHFDSNKTGYTTTGEGETISLSGCYNGYIDDGVSVTTGNKTGGLYHAQCSDTGCGPGVETYRVKLGPVFELVVPPSVEPSCAVPYYLLKNLYNPNVVSYVDKCLTASSTSVYHSLCTNLENQHWELVPDTGTAATYDYQLKSTQYNKCVTLVPMPNDLFNLQWHTVNMQACDQYQSDNKQRMRILGSGSVFDISPDVGYTAGQSKRCLAHDLNFNASKVTPWWNCYDNLTRYNFLEAGRYPPVGIGQLPQ